MSDVQVMNLEQNIIFNLFMTILTLFLTNYSSSAKSKLIYIHECTFILHSEKRQIKQWALNPYSVVDRPPKNLLRKLLWTIS